MFNFNIRMEREVHKLAWQKLMKGDEHALLEIYQQHYTGLLNYGRTIIEEGDFVNDCFIEMLIRLWEKRLSLPPVENVRSYLMTTLRRTIFDRLASDKKRELKHLELQQQSEDHQWSYEEYLLKLQSDHALKSKIGSALKKLTERQLELIRMKFFEDLDYDEISARCGITKRTAYNIVHDAITTLKDELSGDENSFFLVSLSIVTAILMTSPTLEKFF